MGEYKGSVARRLNDELCCTSGFNLDPGDMSGKSKYRTYLSVATTTTKVMTRSSCSRRNIVYKVGERAKSEKFAFDDLHKTVHGNGTAMTFSLGGTMAEGFKGICSKYTNLSGTFAEADYSALIYILSGATAVYANTGTLSQMSLLNGKSIDIRGIGTQSEPVNVSKNVMFIPRTVATINNQQIFNALASACSGMGVTVVSDHVVVDANNNAPYLKVSNNVDLAYGCWGAVNLMLAIMDYCNAGAMGVYAMLKGIHSVVSVAGHTKEGSLMRNVFRTNGFLPSYGAIGSVAGARLNPIYLPMPKANKYSSFVTAIDSVALYSAAMVADCDPLVEIDGKLYPTTIGYGKLNTMPTNPDVDAKERAQHYARQLCDNSDEFIKLYIGRMCYVVGVGDGCMDNVISHMKFAFEDGLKHATRHLVNNCIAPYFWIEPTGIVGLRDTSLPAVKEGFGTLCETHQKRDINYIDGDYEVDFHSSFKTILTCDYRTARTNGILLHLEANSQNGLANINIIGADPTRFSHVGDAEKSGKSMYERMDNKDHIGNMLWKRGDEGLPVPCELMYSGGTLRIEVTHYKHKNVDGRDEVSETHMFNEDEIINQDKPITLSVGSAHIVGLNDVPIINHNAMVVRTRTQVMIEQMWLGKHIFCSSGLEHSVTEFVQPRMLKRAFKECYIDDKRDKGTSTVLRSKLVEGERDTLHGKAHPIVVKDDSKRPFLRNTKDGVGFPRDKPLPSDQDGRRSSILIPDDDIVINNNGESHRNSEDHSGPGGYNPEAPPGDRKE